MNFGYFFFFYAYVWVVTFALVRVISAIFLKQTLAAASSDQELVMAERLQKRDKDVARLQELFNEADKDGGGYVSLKELSVVLEDPRVRHWLASLDLDIPEIDGLFRLLDNGDGCISCDEFLSGIMKARGGAKAIDLVTLLAENAKIMKRLREMEKLAMKTGHL